jgi:hypothetical protein
LAPQVCVQRHGPARRPLLKHPPRPTRFRSHAVYSTIRADRNKHHSHFRSSRGQTLKWVNTLRSETSRRALDLHGRETLCPCHGVWAANFHGWVAQAPSREALVRASARHSQPRPAPRRSLSSPSSSVGGPRRTMKSRPIFPSTRGRARPACSLYLLLERPRYTCPTKHNHHLNFMFVRIVCRGPSALCFSTYNLELVQ